MNPELQSFINFFKNESQLRSAIEALLTKIDWISGVRNLHGAQELGKDIVFYSRGQLGERTLGACVIKNEKISGSASDAKSGARNVFNQAQQALDSPVLSVTGEPERVSHVYVMCPHECSNAAMRSIEGALVMRSGQITFLCGNDLLDLFKKYWKEFVFLQPDLMAGYASGLKQRMETDGALQRLTFAHGLDSSGASFKSVYVRPSFYQVAGHFSMKSYVPSEKILRSALDRGQIRKLTSDLDQLSRVMAVEDLWDDAQHSPGTAGTASHEIAGWSKAVVSSWQREKQQSEKDFYRKSIYERGQLPPSAVLLPPRLVDTIVNSQTYKLADQLEARLRGLISEAHATPFGDEPLSVISRKSYSRYTEVLHVVTAAPLAVSFVDEPVKQLKFSEDLLERYSGHLLITGPPGFGKTSFCRNNVLNDLNLFTADQGRVLPVYIPLHELSGAKLDKFQKSLLRKEFLDLMNRRQDLRIRFYLDGLDEVSPHEQQRAVIDVVRAEVTHGNAGDRIQCVVTAREHVGGAWTTWLSRVRLSPLSDSQLRTLVLNWLNGEAAEVDEFFKALVKLPSLEQIVRVPLLGTLTILVYKTLRNLPENKNRLYEIFIGLLVGGWDLAKRVKRKSRFSSSAKLAAITRLAWLVHQSEAKECGKRQVRSALEDTRRALVGQADSVLSELVEDGLLVPTGRDTYTFPHLSFQEYLAARECWGPGGTTDRILREFLDGNDWWREVVYFLIGMYNSPKRAELWVLSANEKAKAASKTGEAFSEVRFRGLLSHILDTFPGAELTTRKVI